MDEYSNCQTKCGACYCCFCCCEKRQRCVCLSILFCLGAIFGIIYGLIEPSQLDIDKQDYISLVNRYPTCQSYCGNDYYTFGSLCCSYTTSICDTKQTCYNDTISSFNTKQIELKILLAVSIIYLALFLGYYLTRYCQRRRRLRNAYRPLAPPQNYAAPPPPMREPPPIQNPLLWLYNEDGRLPAWIEQHPDQALQLILQNLITIPAPKQDVLRQSINYRNSQNVCSICLQPFDGTMKAIRLNCNHYFHSNCIRDWAKRHNTCPNCRQAT